MEKSSLLVVFGKLQCFEWLLNLIHFCSQDGGWTQEMILEK